MGMSAGGMATLAAGFAFAGGVSIGITVQTFIDFPKADIRGEMVAALEQHAEAQRVREDAEQQAFRVLQQKEMQEVMRGWTDLTPSGPFGRATAPPAEGVRP
jgi:hypothetical protein